MHKRLFPVLLSTSLVAAIPVALALQDPPAWIDEEFRQCMSDAIVEEMDQRIEADRTYSDGRIRDLESYRDDLRDAWQIADEDERRDRLRDADRAYRDASRETKRTYDQRIREIRSESRDAQRECRNAQNRQERFVRDICFSTLDCRSNQICTTERGVCDPSCPDGSERCTEQCAGTCERAPRSSRSSTPRSSRASSMGNRPWEDYQTNGQTCRSAADCQAGYFCGTQLGECNSPCSPGETCIQVCEGKCRLYPLAPVNSSRSTNAGSGGNNCEPYRCGDGREVPSCDANGHPINYFQNPCYS